MTTHKHRDGSIEFEYKVKPNEKGIPDMIQLSVECGVCLIDIDKKDVIHWAEEFGLNVIEKGDDE